MSTTAQQPLNSGFGFDSTAGEVIKGIDLTGKTAIVTGGASGIGVETVRALREAGAQVIVPARNTAAAQDTLREALHDLHDLDGVRVEPLDLSDPASIDAFAERFLAEDRPLHLLINNAGVMATPLARNARGVEMQFAVNHLGHFRLTTRLWPALAAAGGARVVALSSRGHRYSPVVFDDLNFEHRPYEPFLGYGQSKTANVLFAVELDRRGAADGVRAFSVHPGAILDTALTRHMDPAALRAAGVEERDGRLVVDDGRPVKTTQQGAATTIWCATSPALDGLGGVYCEDCDVSPVVSAEELKPGELLEGPGVLPYAVDQDAAARLWEVSEQLM
ncbi:short-chain dehydrogenase/reductase SDR [Catenulispora acidiphila DSM 44928]|uniref:Probable oxidoreductase n=1 Tax=Catenulispora acidiphila (strain DSM 44928 / JCM 14897 / NBRC 102108 / NRRL B-24433 / ID139908) TaxID=479433 RepID=C7Q7L6_CATAD|nr:oxidoreductase [Catenulispora acidiphila]ACU72209.1 short-chain dehydrogenase/reductase SDR [Catenulispora acidiphila DSM 44928]